MSHLVNIKTELLDLAAIKLACADLGLTFKENQKTHLSYGQRSHPCEHAIGVPGTEWEVGVTRKKNEDGTEAPGWTLQCDSYGTHGGPIGKALGCTYHSHYENGAVVPGVFQDGEHFQDGEQGRPLHAHEMNFHRFSQAYAVSKTGIEARKRGWMVQRQNVGGSVKLVLTGM